MSEIDNLLTRLTLRRSEGSPCRRVRRWFFINLTLIVMLLLWQYRWQKSMDWISWRLLQRPMSTLRQPSSSWERQFWRKRRKGRLTEKEDWRIFSIWEGMVEANLCVTSAPKEWALICLKVKISEEMQELSIIIGIAGAAGLTALKFWTRKKYRNRILCYSM